MTHRILQYSTYLLSLSLPHMGAGFSLNLLHSFFDSASYSNRKYDSKLKDSGG
jgi:hypothetical protein